VPEVRPRRDLSCSAARFAISSRDGHSRDMTSDASPIALRSPLAVTGVVALAVLAVWVLSMRALLPLDVLAWTTVLTRRTCWSDRVVESMVDIATVAVILELVAAATIAVASRGLRAAWAPLATVGV